jgi:hypothetical protein
MSQSSDSPLKKTRPWQVIARDLAGEQDPEKISELAREMSASMLELEEEKLRVQERMERELPIGFNELASRANQP